MQQSSSESCAVRRLDFVGEGGGGAAWKAGIGYEKNVEVGAGHASLMPTVEKGLCGNAKKQSSKNTKYDCQTRAAGDSQCRRLSKCRRVCEFA